MPKPLNSLKFPLLSHIVRKIKLRTWIILGALLVLLPIALAALYNPSSSQAAWFNDSWQYRKIITFTHNADVTSERRVTYTFDTQPLTTDKLQADCDDVRFTDRSGRLLRYQLTSACDLVSTTFDVVLASVENSANNTVYFYYGNPSASGASVDVSAVTSLTPSGAFATGSEEKTTGPLSYWPLDEGTDNTCPGGSDDICDKTSNGYGGTRTEATWTPEDRCVVGKCLEFDGSNDTVNIGNETLLGFDNINAFSVQFYMRTGVDAGMTIVSKQESSGNFRGWNIQTGTGGYIYLQLSNIYSSNTLEVRTTSDTNYDDNKWHHVEITYDGSKTPGGIKIYFDGNLLPSQYTVNLPTDNVGTLINASSVYIGSRNAASQFFNGFLDEIKIYNYVRSSSQVKTDFASDGSVRGVSARFGQTDTSFLNDGLVAYWPIDENTGTSTTDKSGNSNNSTTWTGTTWTSGKYGPATSFNGTDQVVRFTETTSTDLGAQSDSYTVSAWFKNTAGYAANAAILAKETGGTYPFQLIFNSSEQVCIQISDGSIANQRCTSTAYTDGVWHLATGIRDSVSDSLLLYIDGVQISSGQDTTTASMANNDDISLGNAGTSYTQFDLNGQVDEARIYNRALSPNEVKYLYNWAPGPISYWNLDEGSGTTGFDRSSRGTNNVSFIGTAAWTLGKFGSAIAASANSGMRIADASTGDSLDFGASDSFTYSAWVNTASSVSDEIIWKNFSAAAAAGYRMRTTSSSFASCGITDATTDINSDTTVNIADGKWHFISCVRIGIGTKLLNTYVDGILQKSTSDTSSNTLANAGNFEFPRVSADFPGYVDEVKVYSYARTSAQIVEDMNGGHPFGGSPVGSQVIYYKFDEQNGANTNNYISQQSALTGSITEALWKTKEVCKANGCLDYDGTNDVVTVTNADAIDIDLGLNNGFTISGWIKPDTVGEGSAGQFFNKGAGVYCQLGGSAPFSFTCNLDYVTADANASVSAAIPTASFTYVAVTFNKTANTISVWINGVLKATSSAGTGGLSADTSNLLIGGGISNNFDGKIDEFKVYSSELRADQIKSDANFGSTLNFGVSYDEASATYGGPGGNAPVGYWKLDEHTGTTITDFSGSGKNATITDGGTVGNWDSGKYGNSYNMKAGDGTPDYMNLSSSISLGTSNTITFWVNFNNINGNGATVGVSDLINCGTNCGYMSYFDGTNIYSRQETASPVSVAHGGITYGQWYHFAVTRSGTAITFYKNGVQLGTTTLGANNSFSLFSLTNFDSGANDFPIDGRLDEVKVYDYARSATQIAYDYNRGGPIGWWKLDECQGSTANDNSGNGNNGTISIGGSGTQSVIGTCTTASSAWGNGSSGKINSSINFDGSDDAVTLPSSSTLNSTAALTLSIWYKSSALGLQTIMSKGLWSSGNDSVWSLEAESSNKLRFYVANASNDVGSNYVETNSAIITSTGVWNHIVIVYNGAAPTIYVNGIAYSTTTTGSIASTIRSSTASIYFGKLNYNGADGGWLWGQVDDARIFNYALSAPQVKKLYNDNSEARFGPSSGTP